jgi:menaquinone-dependent protoporphyrinogen IX oxidase
MADNKTLIAYVTKGGVTEENAKIIANILRENGFEVDIVNLRKNLPLNIEKYKNIIVGSGIRIGKIYNEFYKFLDKNDFEDKKLAFFFSSGEVGNPKTYRDFVRKHVEPTLEKHSKLKIVAAEGFGGRMKILGKTVADDRDPEKVKIWAK